MPDTIIESVLTGKLDVGVLIKWLNNESLEGVSDDCVLLCCNKSEFVAHFLSFLRNQTDSILQTNSNAAQLLHHSTPEKLLSSKRTHHRSISDPTSEDRPMDTLNVKKERHRSHESPSKEKKRTGRRVKTKLFNDERNTSQSASDESKLNLSIDKLTLSSTPIKNGFSPTEYPYLPLASPVTPRPFKEPHERCDTPRLNHSHKLSRTQEKNCLGDFMVNVKSAKKKKNRSSTDNEEKVELDLSNSDDFPEIGARKASSLRSEKRRIKPTNIDKASKSVSLNSFSIESIQTSPSLVEDNSVFKPQKILPRESSNFEVERSMLKQERHKLMEKFNILNTSLPQKIVTPQIKITHKDLIEKTQDYVKADPTNVTFKEKLDMLVDIYDILLNNNLILSVNTEIYFLISLLISEQYAADYDVSETKLKENDMGFLLKNINSCTYFAVKSLWHQRLMLETILDKNSLKILGENKKVRSFYPDLAKFLLNCYGLRCENEVNQDRPRPTEAQANGVICFNSETDNVENYPSNLSFQSFKKQRDMFYEILRWYQEAQCDRSRSSLRARVKALVCAGPGPANLARLCVLLVHHMLTQCTQTGTQESKLSKLQRRLTCPNSTESHRLPNFTPSEMFYKEFIISAESESFRAHLRDALCSEIVMLDATQMSSDDRTGSNLDLSKEYLHLSKKLNLLAKFLGYLTSLPYSQVTIEHTGKTGIVPRSTPKEPDYIPPKEKVFEHEMALRNYTQPVIDLKGILKNAKQNGRLSVSMPWIVHYLSMLDYTALRLNYYIDILKELIDIYKNRLKLNIDTTMKKNTIVYLKSILGWLFDLPSFPHECMYEIDSSDLSNSDAVIDSCDLVDESIIIELCPFLKDLNVLLATCKVAQDSKTGSGRHITPVSLALNHEDRMKNKEKELQSRLEEELLKSQPSSTRRVLELVIERITSAVVRELSANLLGEARERAAEQAMAIVAARRNEDQTVLLDALKTLFREHAGRLASAARQQAAPSVRARAAAGLAALAPGAASPALASLAARRALRAVHRWLHLNWNSTDILCKDIEAELRSLLSRGDAPLSPAAKVECDVTAMTSQSFHDTNISPAECIISLKEQVCLLLEGRCPEGLSSVLTSCSLACSPGNLFGRTHTQRAILQLSLDLCIVYVSSRPCEVTEAFLNQLHSIWCTCCPDRKQESDTTDDNDVTSDDSDRLGLFERVLCPRNIMLLGGSSEVWESMAGVLVYLLKNNYLSEDSLTEQCLAVYRQDWPQNVLERLSGCMKSVSSRWSHSAGKFNLFLDFLAEYCHDMDYEPGD